MLDPASIEYPRFHPITLDQIDQAVQAFGSPAPIAASFALSLKQPSMEARVCEARQDGIVAEVVQIGNHDLTEYLETPEPNLLTVDIPIEYGDVTASLSGNVSSADLEEALPVTPAACGEPIEEWLREYGHEVIGSTPEERRLRFEANFPETGTFTCLDDIANLPTLRYLRRSDFPSLYDWYAFVASEVFEHRFGPSALLHDLRRYVMHGLNQLTFVERADTDATRATLALAPIDDRRQKLAECQLMNGDIELLLLDVVVSMLKHKLGADGLDWYDRGVPERVQDRVEEKWEQGGTLPPEQCFDLLHYKTIMKENWDLFSVLFVEQDDPNPRANKSLRWIGALNHQARLDLAHASRRGPNWIDTDAGKKAMGDLNEWLALARKLKLRCDNHLSGPRDDGSQAR